MACVEEEDWRILIETDKSPRLELYERGSPDKRLVLVACFHAPSQIDCPPAIYLWFFHK